MRVLRQVKINGKWTKLPIAKTATGLDWQNVVLKGKKYPAADGTFYLEYQEDGRKRRRAIGGAVHEAKLALSKQAAVLDLRRRGVEVNDAPELRGERPVDGKRIRLVVDEFVKRPPIHLRDRSIAKYTQTLREFQEWTGKTHVSQLGRRDILDYMAYLVRERKRNMGTAVDKAIIVHKAMKEGGAEIKMLRGDWPKVTERQPDIYTPEMLRPLFAAMTVNEYTLYQTFLLSGFRDQEVGFLAWPDFNEKAGTLRVSKKAGYKFDPKNYKERAIPIPPVLVDLLKKHRAQQREGEYFIFATGAHNRAQGAQGGQRDKHMLHKLKKIALRAGLNCGRCHGMYLKRPANCAAKPMCRVWTLHKFRHTYATTLLHLGEIDVLSLQKLLGHDDSESTMKYLRAMKQGSLAEKINTSAIATMFV